MAPSDFHHPLLGPVLRLATQLPVHPRLTPDLKSTPGEWGGLQHASLLLSRRFTNRAQPYPEHMPKSLTTGMMDEASFMFASGLGLAGTRGFRESRRGVADVEMAALASWLRVERWREALLWTWVVAKVSVWDEGSRDAIRGLFGDDLWEGRNVLVRKGRRMTLSDINTLSDDDQLPLNTQYKFCKSPSNNRAIILPVHYHTSMRVVLISMLQIWRSSHLLTPPQHRWTVIYPITSIIQPINVSSRPTAFPTSSSPSLPGSTKPMKYSSVSLSKGPNAGTVS